MRKTCNEFQNRKAFSLAEIIAALVIGSLVLIAVLNIYGRAERSAAAITRNLDDARLSSEVLQRIAEDLDGIIEAGRNVKITIQNKIESRGFHTARLEIVKTIYDENAKPQIFEKIVWQATFDYDGDSKSLVLYRSHSGIAYEDKLFEESKEEWERELFVPICSGVTFFGVYVPMGDQSRDNWTADALPKGVTAAVSFAEPVKTAAGVLDVPDIDKIIRTVAIDRTRKIRFVYVPKEVTEDQNRPPEDPNKLKQEPNEPNKPDKTNKP
jgi:type II secretory pathway component PulJ